MKPHEAAATRTEVISEMDRQREKLPGAGLSAPTSPAKVTELRIEDLEKHEVEDLGSKSIANLSPPDAMFKPIEYPPLHIFVSHIS